MSSESKLHTVGFFTGAASEAVFGFFFFKFNLRADDSPTSKLGFRHSMLTIEDESLVEREDERQTSNLEAEWAESNRRSTFSTQTSAPTEDASERRATADSREAI